jgi:hypothetical protein
VFDQPPQALQPPCVVLLPGSPWITPRGAVHLDVVAYANPAAGNASALTRLEELVEAVRGGLFANGLAPGDTDQPTTGPDAGVLSARTPTTVRTTCH